MSKIVNLNRYRKLKAQREAAAEAAQNRVRHGRTKAQKELDVALQRDAERKLDQRKLDSSNPSRWPAAEPAREPAREPVHEPEGGEPDSGS